MSQKLAPPEKDETISPGCGSPRPPPALLLHLPRQGRPLGQDHRIHHPGQKFEGGMRILFKPEADKIEQEVSKLERRFAN